MRNRDRNNRDLQGTNIKVIRKREKYYYYYLMPTGELESLGSNRKNAIEAAHVLNLHFRPSGDIAQRIIDGTGKRKKRAIDNVEKLINEYRELVLASKNYTERTLEEKEYKLEQYKRSWGTQSTADITVRDIANFLNPLSDNSYIKHQFLLKDLFGFAIHQGYRDDNPAALTRTKTAPKTQRKRHTLEGYQAIYDISPIWLRNAMDIGLRSLQRRGDLVSLHRDQVDLTENTIRVLQAKTRNYDNPVYIEIEMGKELRAAVEQCMYSDIPCSYLIHTRPERISARQKKAKRHPFAVTEDHLTKTFKKYRDMAGVYSDLKIKERPGFHDIRALGIWLYEKNGFPDSYISALSGHATKAMLEHYKAGHEAKKPVRVQAELEIKRKL